MRPVDPPPPEYGFGFSVEPPSGNAVNGLGETTKSRARHVFHNATGGRLPFDAIDRFFSYINPWAVVRHMMGNSWNLRRRDGPVAARQTPVDDPKRMADRIKAIARDLGADAVGIATVDEDSVYHGRSVPFEYGISLGLAMNREAMRHVPHPAAAAEVMRTYRQVGRIAVKLGQHIREMGWPARAYGNPNSTDILHIPLAVRAGLGQLGKHGSTIHKDLGSNFRLATVLTGLPMAVDGPVDIGVDDLCLSCRRCVLDCPPGAIFDEKQIVRGESKWYVDFDKCLPYFVKTYGCAICIEVCPWSEPGRGPGLSERLLRRRDTRSE